MDGHTQEKQNHKVEWWPPKKQVYSHLYPLIWKVSLSKDKEIRANMAENSCRHSGDKIHLQTYTIVQCTTMLWIHCSAVVSGRRYTYIQINCVLADICCFYPENHFVLCVCVCLRTLTCCWLQLIKCDGKAYLSHIMLVCSSDWQSPGWRRLCSCWSSSSQRWHMFMKAISPLHFSPLHSTPLLRPPPPAAVSPANR
jgi:hypothetical protein